MVENLKNKRKMGLKNFGIYFLFNFLFGGLLVFILGLIMGFFTIITKNILNVGNIIILLILFLMLIINEFIISKITIKISKNKYLVGNFALVFTIIKIVVYTLVFFPTEYATIVYDSILVILIVIFKLIAYFIAKKFVLKEKIINMKWIIIGMFIYIMIIFAVINIIFPTKLNKYLSNSNQFSSIELKNEIVDNYNNNYHNQCDDKDTISYSHKITDEELECFKELNLNVNFTTKDIEKFVNLEKLEVTNVEFNNDIDFKNNNKLTNLDIRDSKLIKFDSSILPREEELALTLKNIVITDNKINIDNSNISQIYVDNIIISDFNFSNNLLLSSIIIKNCQINNLILENNESLEISNSEYDYYLRLYEKKEYYPFYNIEIDKVENIILKNVKDIKKYTITSNIKFKTLTFDNKKIYLDNDEYLILRWNKLTTESFYGIIDIKTDNLIIKSIDDSHTDAIYDAENQLFIID